MYSQFSSSQLSVQYDESSLSFCDKHNNLCCHYYPQNISFATCYMIQNETESHVVAFVALTTGLLMKSEFIKNSDRSGRESQDLISVKEMLQGINSYRLVRERCMHEFENYLVDIRLKENFLVCFDSVSALYLIHCFADLIYNITGVEKSRSVQIDYIGKKMINHLFHSSKTFPFKNDDFTDEFLIVGTTGGFTLYVCIPHMTTSPIDPSTKTSNSIVTLQAKLLERHNPALSSLNSLISPCITKIGFSTLFGLDQSNSTIDRTVEESVIYSVVNNAVMHLRCWYCNALNAYSVSPRRMPLSLSQVFPWSSSQTCQMSVALPPYSTHHCLYKGMVFFLQCGMLYASILNLEPCKPAKLLPPIIFSRPLIDRRIIEIDIELVRDVLHITYESNACSYTSENMDTKYFDLSKVVFDERPTPPLGIPFAPSLPHLRHISVSSSFLEALKKKINGTEISVHTTDNSSTTTKVFVSNSNISFTSLHNAQPHMESGGNWECGLPWSKEDDRHKEATQEQRAIESVLREISSFFDSKQAVHKLIHSLDIEIMKTTDMIACMQQGLLVDSSPPSHSSRSGDSSASEITPSSSRSRLSISLYFDEVAISDLNISEGLFQAFLEIVTASDVVARSLESNVLHTTWCDTSDVSQGGQSLTSEYSSTLHFIQTTTSSISSVSGSTRYSARHTNLRASYPQGRAEHVLRPSSEGAAEVYVCKMRIPVRMNKLSSYRMDIACKMSFLSAPLSFTTTCVKDHKIATLYQAEVISDSADLTGVTIPLGVIDIPLHETLCQMLKSNNYQKLKQSVDNTIVSSLLDEYLNPADCAPPPSYQFTSLLNTLMTDDIKSKILNKKFDQEVHSLMTYIPQAFLSDEKNDHIDPIHFKQQVLQFNKDLNEAVNKISSQYESIVVSCAAPSRGIPLRNQVYITSINIYLTITYFIFYVLFRAM